MILIASISEYGMSFQLFMADTLDFFPFFWLQFFLDNSPFHIIFLHLMTWGSCWIILISSKVEMSNLCYQYCLLWVPNPKMYISYFLFRLFFKTDINCVMFSLAMHTWASYVLLFKAYYWKNGAANQKMCFSIFCLIIQ